MKIYIFILCVFALLSCKENYTPKPYGFFRIDLPEKSYTLLQENIPYYFQIAVYAQIEPDNSEDAEPYWINIVYPQYNAKINLSYKKILTDTSLAFFQHDCHKLAYAHTVKADAINERFFKRENSIYGLLYLMEGNTASPAQFFITDSVKHFLRGALYFNERPHNDSLAPVIEYIRKDIEVLMESVSFN